MPEWHCEPPIDSSGSTATQKYDEIKGKYEKEVVVSLGQITSSSIGETQLLCGFLAETTEDRPISFYVSIVALVYCVVLTIVFAVWASRHPRNTAVLRRVATRPPPQVVIQNQQV